MIWRQLFLNLGRIIASSILHSLVTAQGFADTTPAYRSYSLDNGLNIVAMESHKVPLVTIVLCAKAGAMTETPDINGLTHLWEHMFFKGNQRLNNQEAFNRRVRQLGIVFNGDTSAEMVRYYFTLPSAFIDEGLEFMADAIATPLLETTELERERRVVLDEWDRNASSPGFDMWRLRRLLIYGDLAHRRDPLGDRPVIEKATREQLLRIKDEVFVPANTALLIAGDIDPKVIEEAIKKYFGIWQGPANWAPLKMPAFPDFPKGNKEVVMIKENSSNIQLSINWMGPKARTEVEDSFAADVLISLLNHRSGKFYKKFLDSGLTFQSNLGYHTQSQTGELMLFAVTNGDKFQQTKEALLAEPNEWLKEDYFSTDHLEDVRRNLLISHKFDLNKPTEYIKSLAFWWAVTGLDYQRSYLDNLAKVNLDQIKTFIKKYLVNRPYLITVLASKTEAEKAKLNDNSVSMLNTISKSP